MVRSLAEIHADKKALAEEEGEVVNIGSGQEWSIKDTVEMLTKISGHEVEIVTDLERIRPYKSEVNRLLADNSKIMELTNWNSQISFNNGLSMTYEWVKKNIKLFDVNQYAK